jgi:hypothetical protein
MGIPLNDKFYCQTISDGAIALNDRALLEAIAELKPVIFFDTAIRFSAVLDENASRQNSNMLAADLFALIRAGAKAVVCLHHSPKAAGDAEFMTLENVLRGTGDLGAMCDCVWGLQHDKRKARKGWDYDYLDESMQLTRLFVKCVKPRDFDPAPAFRIQGRPYIDDQGDFVVIADDSQGPDLEERIIAEIERNPKIGIRELMNQFKTGYDRIMKITGAKGWRQTKDGWQREGEQLNL